MFLTSVILQAFNLPVKKNNVSPLGDCHDLGNGTYASINDVNVVGWRWWERIAEDKFCNIGHYTNLSEVKKTYPDTKVVFIDVEDVDIDHMIELRFYKTFSPMKPTDYDNFVKNFSITEWPPKDEVLSNPDLIKESFFRYDREWFKKWLSEIDFNLVDITIPFGSLLGLNDISLESILEENFSIKLNSDIIQYIKFYQEKNIRYITP